MQTAHADCTCSNTHKHAVALSVRLRTAAGPEEVTPPRAERRALADLRREAVVFAQLRSAHTLLHVLKWQTLSVSRKSLRTERVFLPCFNTGAGSGQSVCVPACRWPSAWPAARRSPAVWPLDSRAPPRPQEYPTASAPESARHEQVQHVDEAAHEEARVGLRAHGAGTLREDEGGARPDAWPLLRVDVLRVVRVVVAEGGRV